VFTIAEFHAACAPHDRRLDRQSDTSQAVLFAALLWGLWQQSWAIPLAVFGAMFVVNLLLGWRVLALANRDARLRCPHCAKELFRKRPWVVADRRCPHCGRVVLSDPEPQLPPVLTRPALNGLLARRWRAEVRGVLELLVVFGGCTAVGLACDFLRESGRISHFASESVAVVLLAGLIAWVIRSFGRCRRHWWRGFVACPRCGRGHGIETVKHLPSCWCGQRLVADYSADGVLRT
jgi:uncharacterized protein (DUF983 family)